MTATTEQWKAYQAVKASLREDQQNVLSEIERHIAQTGPGTLRGIDVFNEEVNAWRGGEYTRAENRRFLKELAEVNICAKDKLTIRKPFNSVKSHHRRGDNNTFSIWFSNYFSKVIGAFIRDKKEV